MALEADTQIVHGPAATEGLSLESDGDSSDMDDAEHGHGPHGHEPHGHGPPEESDVVVPSLQVYPIQVKRPIASDFAFSFSWPERMLNSLKRLFGEENVLSCLFGATRSISTHFSGVGTAELAIQMLATAGRHVFRAELCLETAFSCECSASCQAALKKRSPGKCLFANLLERFGGGGGGSAPFIFGRSGRSAPVFVARHVREGRLDFGACREAVLRSPLSEGSSCKVHGADCSFGHVDIDVSGPPCQPWSSVGKRKGRQEPRTALTIAWLVWLRHARPRAAIHENVVGFDVKVLEELVGDMYFIRTIRMTPSDMGFPFMLRSRYHSLLIRRQGRRGTPPESMQALYDAVVRDMTYQAPQDAMAWAFCAPREELLAVEKAARSKRGFPPLHDGPTSDWTYLLTDTQKLRLDAYEAEAADTAGMALFDLGQNVGWSGRKAKIPTFRTNTALLWSRELRRWMTKKERLACMGFPVYDTLALAARVPVDSITATAPLSSVGNAMHVANVGCAIALSCLCI